MSKHKLFVDFFHGLGIIWVDVDLVFFVDQT